MSLPLERAETILALLREETAYRPWNASEVFKKATVLQPLVLAGEKSGAHRRD